jgi:hypothetical protein
MFQNALISFDIVGAASAGAGGARRRPSRRTATFSPISLASYDIILKWTA